MKYILISRKALAERPEAVKQSIELIDLQGALVACQADAELAHHLTPAVAGFNGPFALVADFDFPLAVINDDGSVEPLEILAVEAQPAPLLVEP